MMGRRRSAEARWTALSRRGVPKYVHHPSSFAKGPLRTQQAPAQLNLSDRYPSLASIPNTRSAVDQLPLSFTQTLHSLARSFRR
ncbi:hypothetical protein G7K_5643-t1 [Saitoella complicata NRRL Y-17804]|uniref:Uncharacterized protein n=1 Tax=Saitoella complicata (strain BCRC 22490 / CBS 7301 / JCM 7358 / NBRC 10748 / NRRL Y-17804) TaxID=698492 RepID=A0A0E9NNY2_SAICN|nr:hypothetical protein G7K_5643-t1 [Saitoella complicata NRRL Y-17804]